MTLIFNFKYLFNIIVLNYKYLILLHKKYLFNFKLTI